MKYATTYQSFVSAMAGRGLLTCPLDYRQFCFLRVDCQLELLYIEGVAIDVAIGVPMRDAVHHALVVYNLDKESS